MKNIARIIAVLFIKDGLIVRSQGFVKHQYIGNVIEQAQRLNYYNVDELIYIDISRNNIYDLGRDDLYIKTKKNIFKIIKDVSKVCFMPLTFGGKIRSKEDAINLIRSGADKIIINHMLLHNREEVLRIVQNIGSQAVVASIDYRIINNEPLVFDSFGKINTKLNLFKFLKTIENICVGEIFLQNIDNDGSQKGFDIPTIRQAIKTVSLPVVACSGAGNARHFIDILKLKDISGIAAGNIFNYTERSYPNIKKEIKKIYKNVR